MINDKHDRNFIPIAEEYIRTGLLDEAIDLLKEGVKTYPDYLSARVSLGKAYIEKGMINEAMQEFEHVVSVSPDNLLAHRKLAFLYKEAGRIDSAIKSCEAVLIFSSRDREISDLLRNLKSEGNENGRLQTGSDKHKASPPDESVSPVFDFTSGWAIASEESKTDSLSNEFLTESMGDICIAQGEKAKGIEIFRKILQKYPDNETVRVKLTELGGMSDNHENTLPFKGRERVGMGQLSDSNADLSTMTDSEAVKMKQQIEKLGDFLNRVRTNRR